MAKTKTGAKQSGYVPRKLAEEIKKRATEIEKKAKEKETKDVSAKWQGACVPPDIRRPWDVFHDYVRDEDNAPDRDKMTCEALLANQDDLLAISELGALRAFQELPVCRQRVFTTTSLQELSAFAAWSATSGLADAMERAAAWTALDDGVKEEHVLHNWRAPLAKDPTWHVFIADEHQGR